MTPRVRLHWLRTVKKYTRRAVSPEFTRERGAAWRPFVGECGDGELASEPDFAVADGALGCHPEPECRKTCRGSDAEAKAQTLIVWKGPIPSGVADEPALRFWPERTATEEDAHVLERTAELKFDGRFRAERPVQPEAD